MPLIERPVNGSTEKRKHKGTPFVTNTRTERRKNKDIPFVRTQAQKGEKIKIYLYTVCPANQ